MGNGKAPHHTTPYGKDCWIKIMASGEMALPREHDWWLHAP